jgi:hypothetical protein
MIALEEDALAPLALFDQSVDRLARGRPAIDVITQENANRPRGGALSDIGVDFGEQSVEEIETSMNIAYGIDPLASRKRRPPPEDL